MQKEYDQISLSNTYQSEILYRQVTRLLLVAAEILADLAAMARDAGVVTSEKLARQYLSGTAPIQVDALQSFVNGILKHKTKGYHACNFDLPKHCEDAPDFVSSVDHIRIGSLPFETATAVVVPKLVDIIDSLVHAYNTIDHLFLADEDSFRRVCKKYDDQRTN